MDFQLTINEKKIKVSAEPNMPMLWVIRDLLSLKGTKFGCGKGLCGACTIQVDGKAVRSCQLPISAVGTAQVTTIENLRPSNPVVKAWVKHKVPQCGFCQPGQVMQADALIKNGEIRSQKDISNKMAGNICRCGCYPRIKAAITEAARELS